MATTFSSEDARGAVIVIDHGFSACKVLHEAKSFKIPTAIAPKTETGVSFETTECVYNFQGRDYKVGNEALTSTEKLYDRRDGFFLNYAPLFVAHALAIADCHQLPTKLAVGLPIQWYRSRKDDFAQALSAFRINGTEYSFDVSVYAQGVGAMADYLVATNPPREEAGFVLDVGYSTVIVVRHENFIVQPEDCRQFDQYGMSRAQEKIAGVLKREYNQDLDLIALNQALLTGRLRGGARVNLLDIAEPIIRRHFEVLANQIINNCGRNFPQSDKLILTGGGQYYGFQNYLPWEFRDKVYVSPEPEFANARGFFYLSMSE